MAAPRLQDAGLEAARLEGACHCGAVRVSIPAAAVGVVICHCGDCRRLHGNGFAMLVAGRGAVAWSGDADRVRHRTSPGVQRSFCPRCGSRLAKEPDDAPKLLLSAGLFDDARDRGAIRHLHVESAPAWDAVPPASPAA